MTNLHVQFINYIYNCTFSASITDAMKVQLMQSTVISVRDNGDYIIKYNGVDSKTIYDVYALGSVLYMEELA